MENIKHKVLFLASWYPNRVHPVGGIFIEEHAHAVSNFANVAVLHITPDPNLKKSIYEIEYLKVNEIPTVKVYFKIWHVAKTSIISRLIYLIRYLKGAYRGFKVMKNCFGVPHIVHVNVTLPAGIFAFFLKKTKGISYIITEHWTGYLSHNGAYANNKSFFYKIMTQLIVKNASSVVAVSESLKSAMLSHNLINKYFVVPNQVDVELFSPIVNKRNDFKKKIIHVSLLSKVKNVYGILRVAKSLSCERNDFELHIVGDGPDKTALEALADNLKIKDRFVFFHGFRTLAEIAKIMQLSDFFVMFSDYENLPCAMIEALAVGLPIIATKVGGIPEHITGKYGLLVSPRDDNSLFSAINYMLDNYMAYDAHRIREYAVNNFSYEVVGKKIFNIYEEILRK